VPDTAIADSFFKRCPGIGLLLMAGLITTGLVLSFPADVIAVDKNAEKKLQAVEEALKKHRDQRKALQNKAKILGRDLKSMRKSLIGTAASVQRHEDMVSDFEVRLNGLAAEERAKSRALDGKRQTLANTLGILARLSRHPPEALIVSPSSPVDMVRGATVLSAVVPELESRAAALASELDALRRLRIEIGQKRSRLASANQELSKERTALDRLLKRTARQRQLTLRNSAREKRRLKRLASQARDLKALITKLEEEERKRTGIEVLPPPPGATPFSAEMGRLPLPARGPVVVRYGQMLESGLKSKGIKVATRPRATVVAPHDGRVVFAGSFRSYGRLLIIAHGEGYHTLIAGMAQIDGEVGQWLLAGEPVGQMGATGEVASSGGAPQLYLELRRQGEPINPLTWLALSDRKVNG
jgi:murein hydrolase activator